MYIYLTLHKYINVWENLPFIFMLCIADACDDGILQARAPKRFANNGRW